MEKTIDQIIGILVVIIAVLFLLTVTVQLARWDTVRSAYSIIRADEPEPPPETPEPLDPDECVDQI